MIILGQLLIFILFVLQANGEDIRFVYRADGRPPNVLKADGGFRCKADTNHLKPDMNLLRHVKPVGDGTGKDDGYVSFARDIDFCIHWTKKWLKASDDIYIYQVAVTDKMYSVAETLGKYDPFPWVNEYSSAGNVEWKYVYSWTLYRKGEKAQENPTPNPDFDKGTLNGKVGHGHYQFAGFPPGHPAWRETPWKNYKPKSYNYKRRGISFEDDPEFSKTEMEVQD